MQPIIDKLSIQYKVTLTEVNELIENLTEKFKGRINIRSCKQDEIFFISKSIRLKKKNGKMDSNIFLGFRSSWDKPVIKGSIAYFNLFIIFNPSKLNKELTAIIRYIHNTLNRKWEISTIDLAFDLPCSIKNIVIYAPKRKKRVYRGTIYYGKRNSDGALKVYDKYMELASRKLSKDMGHLTRVEYTHRPTGNNKIPYQLNINIDLLKRYSIHDISTLNADSQKFMIDNIEKPQNKQSKNRREVIKDLRAKTNFFIQVDELKIITKIMWLLNDQFYVKQFHQKYGAVIWNLFNNFLGKKNLFYYIVIVKKLLCFIGANTRIIIKYLLQKRPKGYLPLIC